MASSLLLLIPGCVAQLFLFYSGIYSLFYYYYYYKNLKSCTLSWGELLFLLLFLFIIISISIIIYHYSPPGRQLRIFALGNTEAGGKELQPLAQAQAHIIALHTAVRGDFIAVGDLMKSINLNVFKPSDNSIEEIARDYNPNWVTAIEIIDDDTFIGAEQHFNFFVVRRNSEAATDEERLRLLTVGEFHAGDFINRFRHGSLVMRLSESDATHSQTLLYAGVSGAIGVVATLKAEQYEFFNKLQNLLADPKAIGGIGGLKHKEYGSHMHMHMHTDIHTTRARSRVS